MKSEARIRDCLRNTLWISGGSCAGKSTISRLLSAKHDLPLVDVDYMVNSVFPDMIVEGHHPNLFLLKQRGIPWLFRMATDAFLEFQLNSNGEYLDLLVAYLENNPSDKARIIDAGEICEPGLLAKHLPSRHLVYLGVPESMQLSIWKSRTWAMEMLQEYDDREELFKKWMEFDLLIAQRIEQQCRDLSIPIFSRDENTQKEALLNMVEAVFRPVLESGRNDLKDRT